ncbi:hypothetical protein [Pseudomonas putida]|uniref:hypothetical protein n=1 Tax=Pseudomonas putida TaxID=303 RepID=UPI000D37EB8F|nr:hypothetical protein [Pseudomonas putida]PTV65578.1 hypothetical protein DBL03_03285 [Pseudomonas putida]
MDFDIVQEISADTVGPIIEALNQAEPEDLIRIILRKNRGGSVPAAFALIRAINLTKAGAVEIHMDHHIMSAAAFIWLWFAVRYQENVKALYPVEASVLMYHRPRQNSPDSLDHHVFLADLEQGHPLREHLTETETFFDQLFEELLQGLGYSAEIEYRPHEGANYRHRLSYMREAYYQNQDCVLNIQREMP